MWWSVERLQVQLCLFIVDISLLLWNRKWNKYGEKTHQNLPVGPELNDQCNPTTCFFFTIDAVLALFTMLYCMTEKVIFALCDSSHIEADILLVLGPQCMIWPETSTTSFICLCGLFWGADSYLIQCEFVYLLNRFSIRDFYCLKLWWMYQNPSLQ